jgi:MFS superfamily sulfate permease-like transporter
VVVPSWVIYGFLAGIVVGILIAAAQAWRRRR